MTSEEISENLVETKFCPLCSTGSILVTTVKTINPTSSMDVGLRECSACKHWWNDPLPTQNILNQFYANGSEFVVPKGYSESMIQPLEQKVDPLWEKIYSDVSSYSKKISTPQKNFNYLELGSGSGHLLSFFANKANVAYGIEPGSWGESGSSKTVPHLVLLPTDIRFDLIVAHDVLEHVSDPIQMLSDLAKKTSPGCVIHTTFPNKDSLKAQIQRGKWHMVRPFGHIHYFSKSSIEILFSSSGWKIKELRNCRISENTAFKLFSNFDLKSKNIIYRFIKSLLIGQILLGKDQWTVIAVRD